MKVAAAQYKLDMAGQKALSANETLASAQATLDTALQQRKRLQGLLSDGLVSKRDFELAERDEIIARRTLNSSQAFLKSAQAEQRAAQADIKQIQADAQAKIESTTAALSKVRSELEDIRNSLAGNDVTIARQQAQRVTAPQDGCVLRLLLNPQGAYRKTR